MLLKKNSHKIFLLTQTTPSCVPGLKNVYAILLAFGCIACTDPKSRRKTGFAKNIQLLSTRSSNLASFLKTKRSSEDGGGEKNPSQKNDSAILKRNCTTYPAVVAFLQSSVFQSYNPEKRWPIAVGITWWGWFRSLTMQQTKIREILQVVKSTSFPYYSQHRVKLLQQSSEWITYKWMKIANYGPCQLINGVKLQLMAIRMFTWLSRNLCKSTTDSWCIQETAAALRGNADASGRFLVFKA